MKRRRFIKILATSAAGLSISNSLQAKHLVPVCWQGYALGSEGQFTLYTDTPSKTQRILEECVSEIRRLESLFSLYDNKSELSILNRQGYLAMPSPEWRSLFKAVDDAYKLSDGLYDPTVQPLWNDYNTQFEKSSNSGFKLSPESLSKVGWDHVDYHPAKISFRQPDMSLTLNGIAQGFITDQIAQILNDAGYTQVLVELGETRALGRHPKGRPWRIGIKDATKPEQLTEITELENQSLATSGGYGSTFSKDGQNNHLIHPKTGRSPKYWKSLSVIAPTATQADALSTGLSFADPKMLSKIQSRNPELKIITQS